MLTIMPIWLQIVLLYILGAMLHVFVFNLFKDGRRFRQDEEGLYLLTVLIWPVTASIVYGTVLIIYFLSFIVNAPQRWGAKFSTWFLDKRQQFIYWRAKKKHKKATENEVLPSGWGGN
jgi:hypothetical protein